jgi:hypothetical protein
VFSEFYGRRKNVSEYAWLSLAIIDGEIHCIEEQAATNLHCRVFMSMICDGRIFLVLPTDTCKADPNEHFEILEKGIMLKSLANLVQVSVLRLSFLASILNLASVWGG